MQKKNVIHKKIFNQEPFGRNKIKFSLLLFLLLLLPPPLQYAAMQPSSTVPCALISMEGTKPSSLISLEGGDLNSHIP